MGNTVRLKDIARVVKEYPVPESVITNNGKKCLLLSVEMKKDKNIVRMGNEVKEVLAEYEKRDMHFDVACCIYPTAPFVTAEKLKAAVEQLEASDADTLIPVVSFSYPPQRAMVVEQERLVFKYPEYLDSRSQDLQPHYHDVGQFYVFRTDRFAVNKKLMVGNILPLIVSELEVQDIDNETDWKLAEMKYRMMKGE